jgi:hypothetical protein
VPALADAWVKARKRRRPRRRTSFIYAVRAEDGAIKLGYTIDVERRRREFCKLDRGHVEVLGSTVGTMTEEQAIHRRLQAHRIEGEWYRPAAEVLEVVEWIRRPR